MINKVQQNCTLSIPNASSKNIK